VVKRDQDVASIQGWIASRGPEHVTYRTRAAARAVRLVSPVFVLREFMVEGVVVRSPCDVAEARVVCVAEEVESGPGIRARLTLEFDSPYAFTEVYELAFPADETLQLYFTNRWTLLPVLP